MGFGEMLSWIVRSERQARDPERKLRQAKDGQRPNPASSGEIRRKKALAASMAVAAAAMVLAAVAVLIFGGPERRREAYLLIPSTLIPLFALSLAIYLDHDAVRASLAAEVSSVTLVQLTLFFSAGATVFTWTVATSSLITVISLTFPLILWAWLLEIGIGLATPLRLPGTLAAVTLGLAKRLAIRSWWWWSAPAAAFLLVVLLAVVYLKTEVDVFNDPTVITVPTTAVNEPAQDPLGDYQGID